LSVISKLAYTVIANNLLSQTIIPLRTSDTGEDALSVMSDFYVKHLPIVNNTELLGLISEDDILDHDVAEAVGSYKLSINRPYVKSNDHLYEVLKLVSEYQLTTIPVVNNEKEYLGLISQEDLLRFFASIGSFKEPGSIIVLEMSKRDYSLSQLARIVESENSVILNTTLIDVTLKINRPEIQRIIASFERFDLQVKASFQEAAYFDSLRDRYDSLMSYLNV